MLWGWAGRPFSRRRARRGIEAVLDGLRGDLREELEDLLTVREVDAHRAPLRAVGCGPAAFPVPSGGWPAIPWPPF